LISVPKSRTAGQARMTPSIKCLIFLVIPIVTTLAAKDMRNRRQCPMNFYYNSWYDMENGMGCKSQYIQEITRWTGSGCDMRGTLKIKLASETEDPNRRAVIIDMIFNDNPHGMTFNIGDSEFNDGKSRDGGNHDYDAEMHPIDNTTLRIHRNEKVRGAVSYPGVVEKRVTIFIKDGRIEWTTGTTNGYLEGEGLFALNGQDDDVQAGGDVNYDIFLGVNKAIRRNGGGRFGSGLCKVGIRFLPETDSTYDFKMNLPAGDICTNPYVREITPFLGTGCKVRGTLQIALASAAEDQYRTAVMVDLFFTNPNGNFFFDLGDSSTNNGWGGDEGNHTYDAEIHPLKKKQGFRIYANSKYAGRKLTVKNAYTDRLTFIIQDQKIQWISEKQAGAFEDDDGGLFALGGQTDDTEAGGAVNYDLFLGINQVITGAKKSKGTCKVGIKFLSDQNGYDRPPPKL